MPICAARAWTESPDGESSSDSLSDSSDRFGRRSPGAAVIETVTTYEHGATAGFASRVVAMFIDIVVISISFYAGLVLGTLTVQVLSFNRLDVTAVPEPAASAILAGWSVLYFWAGWWLFGKTVGKAILGLRVVQARRRCRGLVALADSIRRVPPVARYVRDRLRVDPDRPQAS